MILIILRLIIAAAIVFVIFGFLFSLFPDLPVFPGDSFFIKENFTFHFPIITSAVLAGLVTAVLFILKRI